MGQHVLVVRDAWWYLTSARICLTMHDNALSILSVHPWHYVSMIWSHCACTVFAALPSCSGSKHWCSSIGRTRVHPAVHRTTTSFHGHPRCRSRNESSQSGQLWAWNRLASGVHKGCHLQTVMFTWSDKFSTSLCMSSCWLPCYDFTCFKDINIYIYI